MTHRQIAALTIVSIVWGASFLFIRVLVDAGVEPLGVSAGRTVLGLLTLLPFAWIARAWFPRDRRTWAGLAALGFFNFAVPWTLFSVGQQYVPSGVGTIANSAQPLWAALMMAILIPGERLGRTRVAGLMLGFAGVGVLMQSRASGFDAESLRGVPLMLLATVFYAASAVSIRRWFRGVRALPLTVAQIGFAALYLVPLAVATGAYDDASMGWQEWLSLLGLGGAGSGIVVVLYMWLIGQVGPVRAAVVTYLMPPVGIFLGWLLLDEEVSWPMVAGVILIFAGVAAVQGAGLLKGRAEARRSANAAT